MTLFTMHGASFQTHKPEIVGKLLTCPTIAQIVFPAELPRLDQQAVRVESPQMFDISLFLEDYRDVSFVRPALNGENGTQITVTIHLTETILPNVFNLRFSNDHLEQGIITYADLKKCAEEVVPIFRCDHLSVYPVGPGPQVKYFSGPGKTYHPIKLGWMTYFGEGLVEFLTSKRFDGLKAYRREELDLPGGILVSLSDHPFNPDNPEHWERHTAAISELGLDQLEQKR